MEPLTMNILDYLPSKNNIVEIIRDKLGSFSQSVDDAERKVRLGLASQVSLKKKTSTPQRIGNTMTLAVEEKTGKIAADLREQGITINTSTHDLKDHKFVLKDNGVWYDLGEVNNQNNYPFEGTVAPDYVQKKYPIPK